MRPPRAAAEPKPRREGRASQPRPERHVSSGGLAPPGRGAVHPLVSPRRPARLALKPLAPRASVDSLPTLRNAAPRAPAAARPAAAQRAKAASFQFGDGTAFYAVNTSNGTVRTYNEDRVSIVVNVKRKAAWTGKRWPSCSFFAVFDGHGGAACADFLRDNLHSFILDQDCFPDEPGRAIARGCERAETEFCRFAAQQTNVERSGSCAVVLLLVDNTAHIGNVGDSRAILCERRGRGVVALTRDHKPEERGEHERILRAGGTVSQGSAAALRGWAGSAGGWLPALPFRVYPGGLSVARAFGDVCAKDPRLGGRPGVLIARAEVSSLRLDADVDYLLLACDGVFDRFPNKRVAETLNEQLAARAAPGAERRMELCARAVDALLAAAARNLSYDNLTAILVSLRPLEPRGA